MQTIRLPITLLVAVLSGLFLLAVGILNSPRYDLFSALDPSVLLAIALLLLWLLIFFGDRRASRLEPNSTNWRSLIPGTLAGIFPRGAFLGLLLAGLTQFLIRGGSPLVTPFNTAIYPAEIIALLLGIGLGVAFALGIDAHLAAGLFFGYGFGMPTALLITGPATHHLAWTYGGYLAIFGILAVLHLLLAPLLSGLRANPAE